MFIAMVPVLIVETNFTEKKRGIILKNDVNLVSQKQIKKGIRDITGKRNYEISS